MEKIYVVLFFNVFLYISVGNVEYNKQTINEIIVKALDVKLTRKNIDTPLVEFEVSSLEIMDMVCELENELEIEISDEYYKKIKTIADVYNLLDRYPL